MWFIKELLKEYGNLIFKEPPKHIDADVSIVLFKEATKRKKDLKDLSQEIVSKISKYIKKYELINGYLNLWINWNNVISKWKDLFNFPKNDKKVLIEHTSVNPNKALHIGHLRNAILGDSLVRLFKTLNYKVEVLNYIDDTGTQIADVIVGMYFLGFPDDPSKFNDNKVVEIIIEFLKKNNLFTENIKEEINKIIKERKEVLKKLYGYEIPSKFDHYCGDFVYVIVNRLYKIIPELEKFRAIVIKSIEEGNNEIYFFTKKIVKKVLLSQLETLWTFNIFYNLLNKESDILHFKLWDTAFNILKSKGIIEYVKEGDKKGTWSINLTRWKEFKNFSDKYKVLVRSDGTTVYLAKDIAYAMWKHGLINKDFKYKLFLTQPNREELWETDINGIENPKGFGNADISINVIGMEQQFLQTIVSKIIEELSNGKAKYIYYGYGLVMLSKDTAKLFGIDENKKIVRMSGRKGIYINVDNLLQMTYEIALKKLLDRGLGKEEAEELAFKIARSTISFEILKYDRQRTVIFDIDKMTNIEEGNALYLLYTYARINSLLKKAPSITFDNIKISKLTDPEKELLKEIFKFKDVLFSVEKSLEINELAEYALRLARAFNEFYQNIPILKEVKNHPHRLMLVEITKHIFDKLFYILKLDGIEKI